MLQNAKEERSKEQNNAARTCNVQPERRPDKIKYDNVSTFAYDQGGALNKVALNGDDYVKQIHYDAKGQRQHIVYGNNTVTRYTYDALTYQLRRLLTTANTGTSIVQDLNYTYDPSGNITLIRDAFQDVIFFDNTMVSADQEFTYDCKYPDS